jgi:hypothetical protein
MSGVHFSGAEIAKVVASFVFFVAFFCSFGVFSMMQTGDALAFVSSLPIFLSASGILAACLTLIRRDADDDEPSHAAH